MKFRLISCLPVRKLTGEEWILWLS